MRHDMISTGIIIIISTILAVTAAALDSFALRVVLWTVLVIYVIEMIVYRKLSKRGSRF